MQQNTPFLPPDADRVLILVNPKAGARSPQTCVDRLAQLLEQQGFQTEILTDLSEVAGQANQWYTEGRLRALVGAGGDGTAAELVNRTLDGLPLTMIPFGNENLLAGYLDLGNTPESVCQTITDGALVRLDAGKANGRVFLLMASCGFDADVVRRVHQFRKGHIRSRNYIKPILESIRSYEYPELRVYWDELASPSETPPAEQSPSETPPAEQSPPLAARWLFAFNLPCYAGGLRLAPRADGTDGLLDVCAFRRGSLWHGLRYAGGVLLGRHPGMADCTTRRVRRLRITSEARVPYQLDGDPGGFLPVEIEAVPDRLTLVVPAVQAVEFRQKARL